MEPNKKNQCYRVNKNSLPNYKATKQINTGKNANEISHWHIQVVETEKLKININGQLKPINKWICLVGLSDNKKIQTSVITEAVSHNKIRTAKSLYFLNDPIETEKYPITGSLEKYFEKGFFSGWDEIVYKILHNNDELQIKQEKVEPAVENAISVKEDETLTKPKSLIRKKPVVNSQKKLKSKRDLLKKSSSLGKDNNDVEESKSKELNTTNLKETINPIQICHNPDDTLILMSKNSSDKSIKKESSKKKSLGTCIKEVLTQSLELPGKNPKRENRNSLRNTIKRPTTTFHLEEKNIQKESLESLTDTKEEREHKKSGASEKPTNEHKNLSARKLSIEKGYYFRNASIPPTIKDCDINNCEKNFIKKPSIEINTTQSNLSVLDEVNNDKYMVSDVLQKENSQNNEKIDEQIKNKENMLKKGKIKIKNGRGKKIKKKNLLFKPKKK